MPSVKVDRIIQRQNPYTASDAADARGRAGKAKDPARTRYFAEREVQNADGSFPFGEGYLYADAPPGPRAADWALGRGRPRAVDQAGHKGTKHEQQDAFAAVRLRAAGNDAAVLVAADGVSASGPQASRASRTATEVFLRELTKALEHLPAHEEQRHAYVERAMTRAAFVANFEVIRQVLFDFRGDGRYDAGDRARVRRALGVDLPTRSLSVAEMQRLAPRLDSLVQSLDARGRSALTTFAVAVAVDNDLYTFAAGDAVVSLFRPGRPAGRRLVHLTLRDQAVVELFVQEGSLRGHRDLYENVITDSLGDAGVLTGRVRRYPDLLEPGDRVLASSDGLGPRGAGRGLDRRAIEEILVANPGPGAADALVKAQLRDLGTNEYQDNIGVTILTVA